MHDKKDTERLWTPWRMEYILDNSRPSGCVFCIKPNEDDDRGNLILYRGKKTFVIMNRYPYNNGHLLIIPYSHVADMEDLASDEICEMTMEMQRSIGILKKAMNPNGFNVGMNLGKAAGSGIDDHIHLHIVPRWNGDTNFMPVLSDVRVMPEHLDDTYMKLLDLYKEDSLKEE
jgi:ATP adenylyltransferase